MNQIFERVDCRFRVRWQVKSAVEERRRWERMSWGGRGFGL